MYENYEDIAKELGLSASVISKYRQIGLIDDLVRIEQQGKIKNLKIDESIIHRLKNIMRLQDNGFNLQQILHKLVPISIYCIEIENGSGKHKIEKRIHFTLVLSDSLEMKYFKKEPQEVSESEMKEVRDLLIEKGEYELAEKIKFTPKDFTFMVKEFESDLFDGKYLKKQCQLRTIQDKVQPLRWFTEKEDGSFAANELYAGQNQFDNYNQCLRVIPVVKYSGIDKYVIRYNIGIKFFENILFSDQYSYLKDRLVKMYKKRMKELNILGTEEEFSSYSLANIVSEKESKLLSIIRNEEYKTIKLTKSNDEKIFIKAQKSQYSTQDIKEIIKSILDHNYKNVSVSTEDDETYYLTEEDRYKIL